MNKWVLPKSIVILGRRFKIKKSTREEMIAAYPEGLAAGLIIMSSFEIMILDELTPQEQLHTLFHEGSHAAQSLVGIDQTTPHPMIEVICQTHATLFEDLVKSLVRKR